MDYVERGKVAGPARHSHAHAWWIHMYTRQGGGACSPYPCTCMVDTHVHAARWRGLLAISMHVHMHRWRTSLASSPMGQGAAPYGSAPSRCSRRSTARLRHYSRWTRGHSLKSSFIWASTHPHSTHPHSTHPHSTHPHSFRRPRSRLLRPWCRVRPRRRRLSSGHAPCSLTARRHYVTAVKSHLPQQWARST